MFRLDVKDDVNVNSKASFKRFKHADIYLCRLTVGIVINSAEKPDLMLIGDTCFVLKHDANLKKKRL